MSWYGQRGSTPLSIQEGIEYGRNMEGYVNMVCGNRLPLPQDKTQSSLSLLSIK